MSARIAEWIRALTWWPGPVASGCGDIAEWLGSSDSTETGVRVQVATCLGVITFKGLGTWYSSQRCLDSPDEYYMWRTFFSLRGKL